MLSRPQGKFPELYRFSSYVSSTLRVYGFEGMWLPTVSYVYTNMPLASFFHNENMEMRLEIWGSVKYTWNFSSILFPEDDLYEIAFYVFILVRNFLMLKPFEPFDGKVVFLFFIDIALSLGCPSLFVPIQTYIQH